MSAGAVRPFVPASRFQALARVVPASVEVGQVDGLYSAARRLREAAAELVRAADALERLKGGQSW